MTKHSVKNDTLPELLPEVEAELCSWNDFERFLRDRCFPQTRGNCKELLQEMELTDYDPLQIVEKTKGRLADDEMWLRFRYLPKRKKAVGYADH
jgi:hypothetical protein